MIKFYFRWPNRTWRPYDATFRLNGSGWSLYGNLPYTEHEFFGMFVIRKYHKWKRPE